jgi:hypothetical protein
MEAYSTDELELLILEYERVIEILKKRMASDELLPRYRRTARTKARKAIRAMHILEDEYARRKA